MTKSEIEKKYNRRAYLIFRNIFIVALSELKSIQYSQTILGTA